MTRNDNIPAVEALKRVDQQRQQQTTPIPRAIDETLEILDQLEDFTAVVMDKLNHEIEISGQDIHLKLDTNNPDIPNIPDTSKSR